MSNSPQPDPQQEQSEYWDVRGILALRAQIAGMSPLLPVDPSEGIINSKRKILSFPPKPSATKLVSNRSRILHQKVRTVRRDSRSICSARVIAFLIGKNDKLDIRRNSDGTKGLGLLDTLRALRIGIRQRVPPTSMSSQQSMVTIVIEGAIRIPNTGTLTTHMVHEDEALCSTVIGVIISGSTVTTPLMKAIQQRAAMAVMKMSPCVARRTSGVVDCELFQSQGPSKMER